MSKGIEVGVNVSTFLTLEVILTCRHSMVSFSHSWERSQEPSQVRRTPSWNWDLAKIIAFPPIDLDGGRGGCDSLLDCTSLGLWANTFDIKILSVLSSFISVPTFFKKIQFFLPLLVQQSQLNLQSQSSSQTISISGAQWGARYWENVIGLS